MAGLLRAAFGRELTTAVRICPSCGERWALGAHRAYLGAGVVLRCPGCEDVAIVMVVRPDRHVVSVTGTLEM